MKLLPNEDKIIASNEDKIILTNLRIHMKDRLWGQSYAIEIFLEKISSIEVKYRNNFLLLILGIICILAGVYMFGQGSEEAMVGGIFIGGVFLALWWFTRKHIVSITSDGNSSLNFIVKGMGDDKINDFIEKVSLAKLSRVNQLHKI